MAVVWQLSVIEFEKKTLLRGVLLKKAPFAYHKKISGFQNLVKLGNTYKTPVIKNKPVTILLNGKEYGTVTDRNGSFQMEFDGVVEDDILIRPGIGGEPFEIVQNYPVIFRNTDSVFDVISDIDDTILMSYTADFLKRIRTLMLITPHKRKTVDYTQALFEVTKKLNARVFYISKSESNLFALLTAIIEHNRLPQGVMFLTPFLNFKGLLFDKKGKSYKLHLIRSVLDHSGDKAFVLIGDDSQKDMEDYTEIVRNYPGKIKNVLIRKTKSFMTKKQKRNWQRLRDACPDAIYFKDGDVFKKELITD